MEGQCPSAIWSKRFLDGGDLSADRSAGASGRVPIADVAIPDGRRRHAGIPLEESRENSVAWEFERFFPACLLHYEFQAFPGESRERVARIDSQFLCLDSDPLFDACDASFFG